MRTNRVLPLLALAGAGVLWGTTVPSTKLALGWLGPGWLTVTRFALAALLLLWPARRGLRAACTPAVLGWGALGYGAVILIQNVGIARTSVSHAALLVGAVPILVALAAVGLTAVGLGQARVGRLSWLGFTVALAGVVLVAAGRDGATLTGDGLVLISVALSAAFVVAQPRLLAGRDPLAVTAVQFAAAAVTAVVAVAVSTAVVAVPATGVLGGAPTGWPATGPAIAVLGLVVGGTLVPFTLFAYGQARVAPELAGAFLNLEPLVGAAAGALAFGDPVGPGQLAGGTAILGGIGVTVVAALARPAQSRVVRPRVVLSRGCGDVRVVQGERVPVGAPPAGRFVARGCSAEPGSRRLVRRLARRVAVTTVHRYTARSTARSPMLVAVPRPTPSSPTPSAPASGAAMTKPAQAHRRRVRSTTAVRVPTTSIARMTAATASTLAEAWTRSAGVERSYGGRGHPDEHGIAAETVPMAPATASSAPPRGLGPRSAGLREAGPASAGPASARPASARPADADRMPEM
jgi:drug/metabolite transporter (DMT)-like permease